MLISEMNENISENLILTGCKTNFSFLGEGTMVLKRKNTYLRKYKKIIIVIIVLNIHFYLKNSNYILCIQSK